MPSSRPIRPLARSAVQCSLRLLGALLALLLLAAGPTLATAATASVTGSNPPRKPVNLSPAPGAQVSIATSLLEASAFSDPDAGDQLQRVQWQVNTSSTFDFMSDKWYDSTTTASLAQHVLESGKTYYWRVRYEDSTANLSEWSDPTSFTLPLFTGKIIRVPQDGLTIQEAVDFISQSTPQVEIIVSPGVYRENVYILNRNINLHSVDPTNPDVVRATVIEGQAVGWEVQGFLTIDLNHTQQVRVAGFTLRNTGVSCQQGKYRLEHNHLTLNKDIAIWGGSGVIICNNLIEGPPTAISNCQGVIENNTITSCTQYGLRQVRGLICNNLLTNNRGQALDACEGTIAHNVIAFNSGVGLVNNWGTIINNIIWANQTQLEGGSPPQYCCIQGWSVAGDINLNQDPGFVNPASGDYHLRANSPCLDAGGFVTAVARDLEGTTRPLNSVAQPRGDGSDFDIGAYEYPGPAAINLPPTRPTNISPSNSQQLDSILVTLVASPFADPNSGNLHYGSQFQISPDDQFTTLTLNNNYHGPAIQYALDINLLQYATTYWWRIRYQDHLGAWSDWSQPTRFTYPPAQPPARPVNLTPKAGQVIAPYTVTLGCSAYAGQAPNLQPMAQWQVAVVPDFSTIEFDSQPTASAMTSIELPKQMIYLDTTYWWRVRHRDPRGLWSDWSQPTSFKVSDVVPGEQWSNFFPPRAGNCCLVFKDQIYIIGPNDVWSSSDGRNWKFRASLYLPRVYLDNTTTETQKNWLCAVTGDQIRVLTKAYSPFMDFYSSSRGTDWVGRYRSGPTTGPFADGSSMISFQDCLWLFTGTQLLTLENNMFWTVKTSNTGIPSRRDQTVVVFKDRMWVTGGVQNLTTQTKVLSDTWSSTNGLTWRQETNSFPARYNHACVVFNNRLWVIGGINQTYLADVWSSPDGVNWTRATAAAPFGARALAGAVSFKNRLWVIAGLTAPNRFKNDVWSSADGVSWQKETGFTSIQDALDAAAPGADISIPPGRYEERLTINKNVNLHSRNPQDPVTVAATLIGNHDSRLEAITFSGRETSACRLAGFTIRNLNARAIGGKATKATIEYNVFKNNGDSIPGGPGYVEQYGGAIQGCDGLIQNNQFIANHSFYGGALNSCQGVIQNNYFIENKSYNTSVETIIYHLGHPFMSIWNHYYGSGSAMARCNGMIRNNTIVTKDNYHHVLYECNGTFTNNIIWNPDPSSWKAMDYEHITATRYLYNCILGWPGGGWGNFSADPRFVDPAAGNYHLRSDSPCIDAGLKVNGLTTDFDGDARGLAYIGDPRGDGSHYDIGADEFVPELALWLDPGTPALREGCQFNLNWRPSARAGTALRLSLWLHGRQVAELGSFWTTSLAVPSVARVRLPASLRSANRYVLRGTSVYNPSYHMDLGPLAIQGSARNAAGGGWALYE